jgi:soluble lytic murein transglycosylase-like protein
LLRLNPQGHHPLHEAMLSLAEKGHMASLALKLGGMATNDDGKTYDAALYPVPPWQPKGGFQVDRALMYALIRHESQFDPMAVSSQGACGLMQLMPATAALMSGTSSKRGKGGGCPDAFFDPATNIGLGQNYVRHLADQPMIGDNLLLLLAAYNGGPGRLSQRTGTEVDADPLLFMESLPAQETHDYVQQVLIQYWTYRARLHQPLKSLDQMAHGEWPRYALHDTGPTREAQLQTAGIAVASNMTVH